MNNKSGAVGSCDFEPHSARPKVDVRVERNTESVLALKEFLTEVLRSPSDFKDNYELALALKSQGALAKYTDKSRLIRATSLNTMKRIARSTIAGGFEAIDRLRIAAQEAILQEENKATSSNKVTKAGLAKRVKELEGENLHLRTDLLLLTSVFRESLNQAKQYARKSGKESVLEACRNDQRILLDKLSLLKNANVQIPAEIHAL